MHARPLLSLDATCFAAGSGQRKGGVDDDDDDDDDDDGGGGAGWRPLWALSGCCGDSDLRAAGKGGLPRLISLNLCTQPLRRHLERVWGPVGPGGLQGRGDGQERRTPNAEVAPADRVQTLRWSSNKDPPRNCPACPC